MPLQYIIFDSILPYFNPSFIHCVEFNDLKPDKVIETLTEIAQKFDLKLPSDMSIFLNRINRNCGAITQLPSILYAHADDLNSTNENLATLDKSGGFSFNITMPHCLSDDDFVDISSEIEPKIIIENTEILITIKKQELAQIKQNPPLYKAAINYLKGYIKALKANAQDINDKLIKEPQILEYLKTNEVARKYIKQTIDNELNYIKQNHPEFIQKWKYYLEFEKMCAELDGAK